MFLNRLEENEKVAFLNLAHHIARSDGDFSEDEREIIDVYCMEMQIEDIDYNESRFSLSDTLDTIKSKENQKVVLLEIMALIYSDDILHIEEQRILNSIIKQYAISDALAIVYAQWSKSILAITNQGQALIEL